MILRARVVVPVRQAPIPNGAVLIRRNRIAAVGPWRDFSASRRPVIDLGEAALLPGLVNAHCHLDYTDMAGLFLPPTVFTDWLKQMNATKAGWSRTDYSESWRRGARMLLGTGTTTVVDIEAVPELLPGVWQTTPLRVLSFLEMIGIGRRPAPAILEETVARMATLRGGPWRPGLSPHAPYSTIPDLLRLSAAAARRRRWRITTHVAESALEFDMFTRRRGEMFDWLRRNARDMSDCGHGSPVQHLQRCGMLHPNLLVVHANYLAPQDAALLGRAGVSVAHCPRSHFYFRHQPFPLRALRRKQVNVCLGTDSLASVCKSPRQALELNMFEEMRTLAERPAAPRPREILRMATLNGARALGLEGQVGEIAPHALADLIALPFSGRLAGVYDAILEHRGPVAASMIGGRWAIEPGQGLKIHDEHP
ncbi:MAG TPA: amidohydrolase family protein [Dongiaceae bacterium]|nr:amidohydrolase family protein [Dongiaceae bacterium]